MAHSVTPFLMFSGAAEEAMQFYVSVFPRSEIKHIERYGANGPGAPGSVLRAVCTIAGQNVMCIDSPVKHQFTFTPAASLFVECESEAELDSAHTKLVEGGANLMPPGNYGFSKKFAWINDRFGVSWQLNCN